MAQITAPEWTTNCLVDRFKQEVALVIGGEENPLDNRKYWNQAHKLLKIGVLKPAPSFVVYLSDLSPQLVKELHNLDSSDRQFVMKQVVGRIFEDINAELYHNSISRVLKVRLQS
jgi:hypothetical protein